MDASQLPPDQVKTIRGGRREHVLIDPEDPLPGIRAGHKMLDDWEKEVGKKGDTRAAPKKTVRKRKK